MSNQVHQLYSTAEQWLGAIGASASSSLADEALAVARPHCSATPPPVEWAMVMALASWHLENYVEGLAVLMRVEISSVSSVDFFGLLGMLSRRVPGYEAKAQEAYEYALKLDSTRSDLQYNLANLLKEKEPMRALYHYRLSLKLDCKAANVWHNYGSTLNEYSDPDCALMALQTSLMLDPSDADAWCNLGLILFKLDRFEPSKRCFVHSIALDQAHATSYINYGQALIETLQPEQALHVLRRGVDLDSSSSNSLWNLSLALLLLGQYKDGWKFYDARFHTKEFGNTKSPTSVDLIRDLQSLPSPGGTELVVWSEQGLGDGIQFCRYLLLLQARNVPFRFIAPKPLLRLYRDWLGLKDCVCVTLDFKDMGDSRPNIPLLSLPHLFNTELHSIPSFSYLSPPSSPPSHLVVKQPPGGLSVGVAWATNPDNKAMYRHKSLPAATLLDPLLDLVKLDLIEIHSLQVGPDSCQFDSLKDHNRVFDWSSSFSDFADTAHVVSQLDLIISVDTAVAHLSAALNRPTWLLLPHNADFRWLHKRTDSPWYPSMRLFRQPTRGDWGAVMDEVQEALNRLFLLDLQSLANAKKQNG